VALLLHGRLNLVGLSEIEQTDGLESISACAALVAVWGQMGRWDNDVHFKIAVIAVGAFTTLLAIWLVFSF
jgi:hypothetical protein